VGLRKNGLGWEVNAWLFREEDHALRQGFSRAEARCVLVNDSRRVSTVRTFGVAGDSLRYEIQTTAVARLTSHLKMELRQLK
jgi:hypothetical protein